MPFIITPGQLSQRAELYHQLGSLLSAGIGLPQALETLQRNPPARSFREPLRQLAETLREGYTFSIAVERLGNWIPSFDVALIHAGETSGRLDVCCKLLANYYQDRAQTTRRMISSLLYPLFVFHFAILLFPFLQFFQDGNGSLYLFRVLRVLIPLYAGVFALIFACQGKRGEHWRSAIEKICEKIPLLGSARRHLALARLAAALEALINAGGSILGGWELAAAASGSPALCRAVSSWKAPMQAGQTPAEMVSTSTEFPEMFASLYHTGEISGKLDETLRRLHAHYQEEGTRKMHAAAQLTSQIVYGLVAGFVALKVISFYQGMYGSGSPLDEAIKGFGPH